MKNFCTLVMLVIGMPVLAQTSARKNFALADSSCINESRTKVQQFKKNGNAGRFRLDEEFFCHLSRYNKQKQASKLEIVNLGDDKIMSITILEMQVNATNLKGQTGILTADEPLELLKDASFTRCKTLNLDLGKGAFPTVSLNEIESIRIKISFEGQDKVYTIGKEKEDVKP